LLSALGFKRSSTTGSLFASVAYYEANGFVGVTIMTLVRAFLSEVARGPEGIALVGGIGDDAKFGELTKVAVALHDPALEGPDTRTVGMLKLRFEWRDSEATSDAIVAALGEPAEGVMRLYHGTSIAKATRMLQRGNVDTKMLESTCDFGQGLYTFPKFECALYYSFTRLLDDQAVVIFDVDEEKLGQLPSMPDLRLDLDKWRRILAAFLDGGGIRDLHHAEQVEYLNCSVIKGPISGTENDERWEWTQLAFFPPQVTRQMLTEEEGGLVRSITVVRLTGAGG